MLKMDSPLAKAIGYTSDMFNPVGSFIWDLLEAKQHLAVMYLTPYPEADRPIGRMIYKCERLNMEIRFYDFPQNIQEKLLQAGFEKVVEKCGTTYLHNRARLLKALKEKESQHKANQPSEG